MKYLRALLLLFYMTYCDGANILYAIPFMSKSHDIFLRPVGLELARRGHNVTVITVFEEPDPPPNYYQVVIDKVNIWNILGQKPMNFLDSNKMSTPAFLNMMWYGGLAFSNYLYNTSIMQDFLRNDNKFDLVMTENFVVDANKMLAYKYNAPLVLISSIGNCMRHNIAVGNPLNIATVPYEYVFLDNPTSFISRLTNLYITIYEYMSWRYWYLEEQMKIVKKYIPDLNEPVPSLYEMHQRSALYFINSHFSLNAPVAYMPNIVGIGGIHLSTSNVTLTNDLEKVLNESKHGVIYMNFGSMVQSTELPIEKRNAFLNYFKNSKYTVLLKWEQDEMDGKPDNVVIREWFPQNKILEHPNIKLFISHGGLISTQEAIFHGVPILGVPIFGDQYNNLQLTEQAGFGKILKYGDINEKNVQTLLDDMTKDPRYMNNAKDMSRRFRDRPMSPSDTAVYWVEAVLRNNGTLFKNGSPANIDWITNNMLDVYAFLLISIVVVVYTLVKLLNLLMRCSTPSKLKVL